MIKSTHHTGLTILKLSTWISCVVYCMRGYIARTVYLSKQWSACHSMVVQGLDPASRRNLWDVVKAAKQGTGIVLTTHSMEEAEVLCDRLAIFVNGQIVCIGNPKALTAKFGNYLVSYLLTFEPCSDIRLKVVLQGSRRIVMRAWAGANSFSLIAVVLCCLHMYQHLYHCYWWDWHLDIADFHSHCSPGWGYGFNG